MQESKKQNRRDFLGKTLVVAAVAAFNPISVFLKPSDLMASETPGILSTNFVVDLAKYTALANVNGSVAITITGTKYTYQGGTVLPFRFVITRTAASTFVAVAGYCTHELSSLDPFNGTVIICSNPDPGHGSQFAASGAVAKKPAKNALEVYSTSFDAVANTVTVTIPKLAVGDLGSGTFAPELSQNFPNPAKAITLIRFTLPYYSRVSLTVSDSFGHVIAVLTDGTLADGSYSFEFDASIWPSGTYFYQLRCGNDIITKQMMIVK